MKVVTWNVNSIQSRLVRVIDFLQREEPDLLCLQETKCIDEKFPFSQFEALGYQCAVSGQKAYNGVALISRQKPSNILKGMNTPKFDQEARVISASLGELHVVNVYVPNGQAIDSDKYQFKLQWLLALEKYLQTLLEKEKNVLVCGDFNIANAEQDVYDPLSLKDSILFSEPEKSRLEQILQLGFYDLFREIHPHKKCFSWWDYRKDAFSRNNGLRIDLMLGTNSIKDNIQDVYIDINERKGELPSDHAPVISIFQDPLRS